MQKQILSKFINFRILIFAISIFSCGHVTAIDREIENAIENSDTQEMLRLVSGNFTVSAEEKAYYLKLADAKSTRAMSKVYNSLPKFSRTLLGFVPAVIGTGLLIYAGSYLVPHIMGFADYTKIRHLKDRQIGAWFGLVGLIMFAFGAKEIHKGIVENNEVIARDNALAIEAIVSRMQMDNI